jgi:hypothetical protein
MPVIQVLCLWISTTLIQREKVTVSKRRSPFSLLQTFLYFFSPIFLATRTP